MNEGELKAAVRRLVRARKAMEVAKGEYEAHRDIIKEYMATLGADEVTVGDYRISYKDVTTMRLDADALRATMPDVSARFTVATTSKRLRVASVG